MTKPMRFVLLWRKFSFGFFLLLIMDCFNSFPSFNTFSLLGYSTKSIDSHIPHQHFYTPITPIRQPYTTTLSPPSFEPAQTISAITRRYGPSLKWHQTSAGLSSATILIIQSHHAPSACSSEWVRISKAWSFMEGKAMLSRNIWMREAGGGKLILRWGIGIFCRLWEIQKGIRSSIRSLRLPLNGIWFIMLFSLESRLLGERRLGRPLLPLQV